MKSASRNFIDQFGNALLFTFLIILTGGMTLSFAAEQGWPESPLRSELQALAVEKTEDGEEVFTQAERVEPGELVEYRLRYENVSEEALTEIMATGPIHESTDYVEDSATATLAMTPQFSIDRGSNFQIEPVTYQVELADGSVEKKEAAPDMYTHVRWRIPELAPEATTELRYRVRVR